MSLYSDFDLCACLNSFVQVKKSMIDQQNVIAKLRTTVSDLKTKQEVSQAFLMV